ncbi:MAG: hypothetical protein D6808_02515 [Candidatus Dadabacteria bacterium]|nr:MAG: hypothetical protein D6808_02515 [Candidatus Dadabacteria bacterium]
MDQDKANFRAEIKRYLEKLSLREKALIAVGAFVLGILGLYALYQPIHRAFDRQERMVMKLSSDAKDIRLALTQYLTLKQRLGCTERKFKRANLSARIRTHLEKVLENEGKIPTGQYNIKRNAKRLLGEEFELSPYTIKFDTTSLKDLVSLLQTIFDGSKPLLITRLDIQKSRRSDKLSVTIDVTSIRKVKSRALDENTESA